MAVYHLCLGVLSGFLTAQHCHAANAGHRVAMQALLGDDDLIASTRRTRSRVDDLESRVAAQERVNAKLSADMLRVLGVLVKHGLADEATLADAPDAPDAGDVVAAAKLGDGEDGDGGGEGAEATNELSPETGEGGEEKV